MAKPTCTQHPVADARLGRSVIQHETDIRRPPHTGDLDDRQRVGRVRYCHDLTRNAQAHVIQSPSARPHPLGPHRLAAASAWSVSASPASTRAAATAACPSARPPSFAGTSTMRQHGDPALRQPPHDGLQQHLVLEHPAREGNAAALLGPPQQRIDHVHNRARKPAWNRAAMTGVGVPAATSSSSAGHNGAGSSCSMSPSWRNGERIGGARVRSRPRASSSIAAWPSYSARSRHSPAAAATASNKPPAELDRGALTPRAIMPSSSASGFPARQRASSVPAIRSGKARPAERRGDLRIGVAPWLADRLRAAGHRDRFQASDAPEATIIAQQELAAPDRAVIAPAQPVQHHAQHRRGIQRHGVLRQARGHVRVVVLHRDDRQRLALRQVAAMFGRQVFGMPVNRDHARRVRKQRAILVDGAAIVEKGWRALQIANVMRQHALRRRAAARTCF